MSFNLLQAHDVDIHSPPFSPSFDDEQESFRAIGRGASEQRSLDCAASSDEDEQSEDFSEGFDHLVKKSSLRSSGSPSSNKSVSFNENVMRKNENFLTVERLKPASEPVMVHSQWHSHSHRHEHHHRGSG